MNKPIYIIGTGLSHNGSAVLLKDGQICVAIEKERLSRKKHDGGNDTLAIQYCLDTEGIGLKDVSLVVQCENFNIPERSQFKGKRLFSSSETPEIVTISHHLAHAYSAVGTSPFQECHVMVIDGCGSPLDQFLSLHPEQECDISPDVLQQNQMQCEKESFYHFDGQKLQPLFKDFSTMARFGNDSLSLPTTEHSIGGFYASVSKYVFGNMDDVGKLMGLAPYGQTGVYDFEAFEFRSQRLYVKEDWKTHFTNPSSGYDYFKENFDYYANIARWAQEQVEKAVLECFRYRMAEFPHQNVCYSGGVALNAVANAKVLDNAVVENLYIEPAAADNGLALGCAFYGWLEHLGKSKEKAGGSTCFGKKYDRAAIVTAIEEIDLGNHIRKEFDTEEALLEYCAIKLSEGQTLGWFHSGSEFGPRALGRRSILAHPGIGNLKDHINRNIKFREDFRPFAPAVLEERVGDYFEKGRKSPYMILVDKTKPKYRETLQNVTHKDGSARVQTIDASWNPRFAKLVAAFYDLSGIAVVLNTSLNRKGMPMVEAPAEALQLFRESAMDVLVLENIILEKLP
ncbi:carbamoyltransferase family protein [Flavobacterium humi]|uniref:Transferase n=1 Tax=Flavobacterium humi TaxID=2562683 RepID=A0A4Z0L7J6_9FLAO|nr:carbamoyltransferase C-terminal domain-containing protein [Flavobacterium humi]TGD57749.1 transferase [Flavobacterium humi]